MTYKLDYDGEAPAQLDAPLGEATALLKTDAEMPRPALRLSPVAQTVVAAVLVAVAFFSLEKFGPRDWRPSYLVGSYEADVAAQVEAQVAASRLQQQAQFDAWVEEVRLVNAQNLEQYRGLVGSVAAYYQASYDRSRVYAEATARMQSELVQSRVRYAGQMRSADQSVVNLSRLLGFGMNAFSPGSGDSLMRYSDDLADQVYAELDRAATSGRTISVQGWDSGLPPPSEVQMAVNALTPRPLPEPPVFSAVVPPRER